MPDGAFMSLPPDLPAPPDDGACRHLEGVSLPRLALRSTMGRQVSLRDDSMRRTTVVFAYPKTGVPGRATLPDWDAIPGARGCTPQACAFRDAHAAFAAHGASVFGLSTQTPSYQHEAAQRLQLPFEVLSDHELRVQKAIRLPTFDYHGERLLKRVTFVVRRGRIVKVFYPVFPTDQNAAEVLEWLGKPASGSA